MRTEEAQREVRVAQDQKGPQILTTGKVLTAMQKVLTDLKSKDSDYEESEPFPVEVTELFLYSPDMKSVLLVFPFLGQDFVLSEDEISTEVENEVVSINEPLKSKILEFLVFRIKLVRDLSI